MNYEEVGKVLAKIKIIDNRKVDEIVIREWHDIIGGLNFEDAIAAVKTHRQTSTDYLMPAHVVIGAQQIAATRSIVPMRTVAELNEHRERMMRGEG